MWRLIDKEMVCACLNCMPFTGENSNKVYTLHYFLFHLLGSWDWRMYKAKNWYFRFTIFLTFWPHLHMYIYVNYSPFQNSSDFLLLEVLFFAFLLLCRESLAGLKFSDWSWYGLCPMLKWIIFWVWAHISHPLRKYVLEERKRLSGMEVT